MPRLKVLPGHAICPQGAEIEAREGRPARIGVLPFGQQAVRVVRDSGLPNRTDSMFTTIEGDWDEVMAVVRRAMVAAGSATGRVSLVLKADDRAGVSGSMTSKVESIERRLQG